MDQSKIDAARAKIALGQATTNEGVAELLAATAPPVVVEPQPPKPIPTPTTKVSSLTDLQNALKAARPGAVIQLAKGSYGALTIKGLAARDVRVIGEGATLAGLRILDSSGMAFEAFAADLVAGGQVQVSGGSKITLAHMSSRNAKLYGFNVIKSMDVDLLDCDAADVKDGFALAMSRRVSVQRSTARRFRADGINACGVSQLLIDRNVFTDARPTATSHNDGIQLQTGPAVESAEDIVISNNIIHRGDGGLMQGIFLKDETDGLRPYRRVSIRDNQIVGCMQRGLSVSHAEDLEVGGNLVQPIEGQNSILALSSIVRGRVWDNRYWLLEAKGCTDLVVEDKQTLSHISAAQALALLPPLAA